MSLVCVSWASFKGSVNGVFGGRCDGDGVVVVGVVGDRVSDGVGGDGAG